LTYANTCEKPRVGEFGGGAMFVTADNIVWEDSYTFVAEQVATCIRTGTGAEVECA
jgi:hypothetical protein